MKYTSFFSFQGRISYINLISMQHHVSKYIIEMKVDNKIMTSDGVSIIGLMFERVADSF